MAEEDIEYEENYSHHSHEDKDLMLNEVLSNSSSEHTSQSRFSQMTIYVEKDEDIEDDEDRHLLNLK